VPISDLAVQAGLSAKAIRFFEQAAQWTRPTSGVSFVFLVGRVRTDGGLGLMAASATLGAPADSPRSTAHPAAAVAKSDPGGPHAYLSGFARPVD